MNESEVFFLKFENEDGESDQIEKIFRAVAAVRREFFEEETERARSRERERSHQMPLGGNSLDLGTWQR